MKYFTSVSTMEEAKSLYKRLARENHPDLGGDLRTMQAINAEFASFCANFARRDAYARQAEAHKNGRKSAADFHNVDEVSEWLRVVIEFALNLQGVEVELMGLWVWLTGETKKNLDQIHKWNAEHPDKKFKFARKKAAWYFAGVPSMGRGGFSLDDIRATYGSMKFQKNANARKDKEEESARIPAYATA